ncbi:uncharacterized protein EI90DRAFT_339958 [Cantharellus anzutake]|uniref:uncharacterized protein n=1 Tax=Cantharellus anzutake TaxID=1750568 RepID=UPI001902DD49|nr:uncharacterized protein EI90DRAFT_339958 [Cantharellus anzutake]KAF8315538.1 hypothetical protein EI90DRAFT_339958 [Cantharellus anzutake]
MWLIQSWIHKPPRLTDTFSNVISLCNPDPSRQRPPLTDPTSQRSNRLLHPPVEMTREKQESAHVSNKRMCSDQSPAGEEREKEDRFADLDVTHAQRRTRGVGQRLALGGQVVSALQRRKGMVSTSCHQLCVHYGKTETREGEGNIESTV